MKKILQFFALISLIITLSVQDGRADAAKPVITGTFLQLWDVHATWTEERWQSLFAALRAIGVDEVVVQWTVDGATPTYASKYFTAPARLTLEKALRAARDQHIRVVLGLVHDQAYWEKIKRDPNHVRWYFRKLCTTSLAAAEELLRLDSGKNVVSGLYIPQEIDDQSWLEADRQAELLNFLKDLRAGLRILAPHLPVAVSGFSNGYAEPETLKKLWQRILTQSGIDRVLFQDGVGAHKLNVNEVSLFFGAVSQAAEKTGRVFTPVVEVFTQVDGAPVNQKAFRAVPAPLARIKKQLKIAGSVPHSGIMAFSLPEYCSPFGGEQAAVLYKAYKEAF
ncbi:DUF4434 domain-containing protein [Desulfovibrio sp. 86]|uniref:DUF4434 domain-containing protein n=1 Tax=uncultured Desulfovibrio sp. TaxID=167968 RepID=A0A212L5N0_9BACT|nr:DUF4434 domain-containing protein [Desulfovibrio sp. 86]SCM72649.1 conserved exported hypothetical protein [uncultured Desulfovibrio sp.]VZH33655.1 conserved protein of unknown function [Desulfovibrio sp. 86]